MVRQTLIVLAVTLELFLVTPLESTGNLLLKPAVAHIEALQHEIWLIVQDVGVVGYRHCTLAEREIVHRIQQIGLSHSVAAYKAVYLWRERHVHLAQVPVV